MRRITEEYKARGNPEANQYSVELDCFATLATTYCVNCKRPKKQHGHILYGHEGSDDGFRSSFWICPELGTQITVLSNISEAPVKKINKSIFTALQ